ncbi:MAG: hypothetical protein GTO45_09860 [Candidatus Aminicenantes bacterium]|nr:hypothetical protein [Candidatus Aminicenantes bacterium]NIM79113.1 hypothetical protein [Candidatus Aminicenantes bacterium]NIN18398.1 hypothetical protein [Candidatus Aminicenantes bacterium]NIN42286.1 hypothetical protein [Candidatus Aminicenantes bacterium]NIN85052.1 hypothetical protein [Candidatus Aminicenantes bacterium]
MVIACCADKRKDPEYRDYDITVALAVENMLLEATECGLGACYVSCYGNHMSHQQERGLLQEILQLPDYIRLVCLITIGYPNEKPVKKELIDLKHIIHFEKWSKK